MATTTVRLDPDEELALDELAEIHGGRSNALRIGLRLLAAENHRHAALAGLLTDWDAAVQYFTYYWTPSGANSNSRMLLTVTSPGFSHRAIGHLMRQSVSCSPP